MMNPNNFTIKEKMAMRKRYGSWTAASLLAVLAVLFGISSVSAQPILGIKYYPTLSLRNFHCYPDGIQRIPYPAAGGDRYFLVPVWIFNEVDSTFNPNTNGQYFGQHLEPIRSFEFQFTYLTQAMALDVNPAHGSPVVMIGPGPTDTALAKSFFVDYSDQADNSTGNPYLHRVRLAASSSVSLPLANTSDSGCIENNGILLWLRFKVIVSPVNAGEISLDSSRFNDHLGDSLINGIGGNSYDYRHGNFGGGIGLNGQNKKGFGLVQLTAQPTFDLRPLSQITAIDNANYQLNVDLVYDPTTGASSISRLMGIRDGVGGTELDNVNICSNVSWLVLNQSSAVGGLQCQYIKKIDFTSAFGSQEPPLYLNIPNPSALAPGIYYAIVTFTSDGALNSPTKLLVRFIRLANPSEPAPGGKGTGVRLNISNSCNPVCTNTIAFGTGPGATEGMDLLYGENPVTIADTIAFDSNVVVSQRCYAYFKPLNTTVDPRFLDPNFVGLTRDIRSDLTDTTLIYQVVFSPGDPNCYPVKVCVNTQDFPDGSRIVLKMTLNGSEQGQDLRNATLDANGNRCVTILDPRINHFYIYYTPATIVNITAFIKKYSWTLISLPVIPPNPNAQVIFPNAVGVPWSYSSNSGWNQAPGDNLEFGRGYMIRYGDYIGTDGTVAGVKSYTVDNVRISQGWNTIGGVTGPADMTNILLTPNAGVPNVPTLLSSIWEFTPQTGYDVSNFIIPGRGYFIKVDASGFYSLHAPVPANGRIATEKHDGPAGKAAAGMALEGQLARITVTDADQNGQRLYCGSAATGVAENFFEMPTSFRDFDARFAATNGNISFNHSTYTVNLKSGSYPVTMAFSNLQGSAEVRDMRGNVIGTASNGGVVTISDATLGSVQIALKSADGVPTNGAGYALEQNVPNPFGAQMTTIRYSVPQEVPVSLVVYNALGQVVATLVSEVVGMGTHEAVFNGTELPAGTYYYTMKAGNFVQTQHMTLAK